MIWKKGCLLLLSAFVFISTFFGSLPSEVSANVATDFQASVMAPLTKITDWNAFKNQLKTLKNNGVYALTTDVWWGDVEAAGDNQFDWSYYKTYANAVTESGLKWVPILSTHTCGGNPGDDCNIPIPAWLWNKGTADDMKYKSETGYVNNEAISPFWSGISTQYNELYASFAQNFASYKPLISKIYLSAGPSGELRYPSYYQSAGWSYPSRGRFQVYTDSAKNAFRAAMITKYGSLNGVNQAWGLQLTNTSQINPPADGDSFYSTGGYNSTYGKDFLAWNQSVLENHLGVIATAAHNQFDSTFGVRIGAKISGIHWQMNNPSAPHSAEHAAGYYNYNGIIQKFKESNLDLTFTALEMYDSGSAPAYSQPSTLVDTVSSIANAKGVRLNGENALPTGNFQKIEEQIMKWGYNGFTLLRLANLVNSDGSANGNMANFKQYVINHAGTIVEPGDNQVTIYYKKGYAAPYIHYRPAGGTWTTAPGTLMPNSEITGYAKMTIDIGSAVQLEAAFNNGSGTWDSNNTLNYLFNEGISTYTPGLNGAAGTITAGAPLGTDTTAPSVPTNLMSTGKTDTSVALSWTASTDMVGVTGYEIWRDGAKVGTTASTSYNETGLTASTAYSFSVKAFDAANNISGASAAVSITTNPIADSNSVTVYYKKGFATPYIHYRPAGGTWTAAPGKPMPNSEITGYAKFTVDIGTATQLEACFNNGSGAWDSNNSQNYLFGVGTWTYTPGVNGAAGTVSPGPTQGTDTTAPTIPTNLSSTSKTDTSVSLSWMASTDTVGVTGYEIWRNGAKVATTSSTSSTQSGLTASTAYNFSIKAYDAAGNTSEESAVLTVTTNPAASGNSVTIYYKKGYATPYIHYRPAGGAWTAVPGKPMPDSEVSGYAKIVIDLGTAVQLEAVFNNGSGTWDNNNSQNYRFNAGLNVFTPGSNGAAGSITQPAEFPPANAGGGTPLGTDWSKQSIYFIMTDRFSNGDTSNDNYDGFASDKNSPTKWHGGDFQGVINNLDYIKNLGFTAIWITPVTAQKSPFAYHGYHTYDFYSIDGHLGSMDKLKELVSAAHSKNIAVMFDVVPNHTGDFQPGSGYAKAPFDNYDWYHHNGEITSNDYNTNNQWKIENGEVAGLDDLNQENAAAAGELKNWIAWLIDQTKIDGLRVDTAKHVPKWFLKDFDTAANSFTIGEVFHGDPGTVGDYSNYLDAVLDFPMYYTMKDVFGHDASMLNIKNRYAQDSNYRDARLNGIFLDNHDVKRFLNDASGRPGNSSDKWPQLKAALGFMLTSRGIPILYQGTELGYSGGDDPQNREDVNPNPNHELYKYIAKINAVRNSHPALQNGTQKERGADGTFYSFQRSKDNDEAIVMINNSWSTETRSISNIENISNGTTLKNQIGTDSVQLNDGTITVTLAPKEVKIFTK